MSLSPELTSAYRESTRPFIEGGGAITEQAAAVKGWRIFLEVNSKCSLHCPSCTKGDETGYEHLTGFMDPELMERILDKIKSENPEARIMLYGNSEPWIHPHLPECIASVKRRGLLCEFSTNLNFVRRVDEVFSARPDMIIISLSGFTQEVYVRGHAGGNIDKVKENMRLVSEAHARAEHKTSINVNFHVYDYNEHEIAPMKEYATNLGIGFFTSIARAISMEKTVQFCRAHDPDATPFEVQPGRPDWNVALPPPGQIYEDVMKRLRIPPTEARDMYKEIPMSEVCPVGAAMLFTFIRHDGLVQMCACTADRRITLGNYLDLTPDQMIEQRTGHAICKQCIKYRLNLYYMIASRDKWISPT